MNFVKPKWRTQFTKHDAFKYATVFTLPSKTKQADRDRFNPNNVMRQFQRTGDLNLFKRRQGYYADITHLSSMSSYADVQAAMEPILDAFYSLPALEREKFGNNPMNFLDFAKDPANLKWLVDNGFLGELTHESELSGSPTQGKADSKSEEVDAP